MKRELPWELLISKLKNDISAEQAAEFDRWLAVGDNQGLFVNLGELWREIQSGVSAHEPDVEEYWRKLSERLELSAAAAPRQRRFALRRAASVAAVILVAATAGFFGAGALNDRSVVEMSYSTMSGKSQIYLPDGTLVWLHNDTKLTYDTGFGKNTRTLSLDGEAYFEVVKDTDLPFVVNAGEIMVEVHGTKFNVRNRADEDRITVSLLEGAVAVETPLFSGNLTPGWEAVYFKTSREIRQNEADVAFASSWTGESISFRHESLGNIVQYLSKWYDVDIRLGDEGRRSDFAYTFTLRSEPLDEIMRLISRITPIDYYFDKDNVLYINVKPK